MQWTQNTPTYGDMIRIKVKFYHHYGIYVDEKTVVQFGMPDNGDTPADDIEVITTDIATFAGGQFVETAKYDHSEKKKLRSPKKIVELALSRVGERGYNILSNNCEHFATECVFGEKKSFLDDVRIKIRNQLNITL